MAYHYVQQKNISSPTLSKTFCVHSHIFALLCICFCHFESKHDTNCYLNILIQLKIVPIHLNILMQPKNILMHLNILIQSKNILTNLTL